jgi:uncharacterized membrane protein
MNTSQFPGEVTSDDKLWAALAYAISPLIPILILLMADKKDRPFIKAHNIQALVTGVVLWVILAILGTVTCGIGFLGWIFMFYLAYLAYQGKTITIPLITDFVKNQGW